MSGFRLEGSGWDCERAWTEREENVCGIGLYAGYLSVAGRSLEEDGNRGGEGTVLTLVLGAYW